jgi:hypothetical protein
MEGGRRTEGNWIGGGMGSERKDCGTTEVLGEAEARADARMQDEKRRTIFHLKLILFSSRDNVCLQRQYIYLEQLHQME